MTVDTLFTVHAQFVAPLLKAALKKNIPRAVALAGTDIAPDLLDRPNCRISVDQYNLLAKRLWRLFGDEHIGLGPYRKPLGTFRMLCELAINSNTVADMFEKLCRYYPLLCDFVSVEFWQCEDRANFSFGFTDFDDTNHLMTIWTLLCWHRFACWMSDEPIQLGEVSFVYPEPDHPQEYEKLFGCRCRYSCHANKISFDSKYLRLLNRKTWHDIGLFIRGTPGTFLAVPSSDSKFAVKVKRLIVTHDMPWLTFRSVDEIADCMQMGSQTLRRRLRSEGTSYRTLKNSVRRNYAIELLHDDEMTIVDVGHRVGYSDPSGFSRAFKNWMGTSPEEFRSQIGL